jgi:hypothetical protein
LSAARSSQIFEPFGVRPRIGPGRPAALAREIEARRWRRANRRTRRITTRFERAELDFEWTRRRRFDLFGDERRALRTESLELNRHIAGCAG